MNGIRDEAEKHGAGETKEELWQYFVSKCCKNMHIVLCMSPTGDKLRNRCRSFPGMVNNTVIDWFLPWPEEVRLLIILGIAICGSGIFRRK